MSARIANAIAEVYLADQVDNKNEANRRATEWLEERLAELRRNLQVAEEAVATYRRDKGLAGSPEGVVSTQTLVGPQQPLHRRQDAAHREGRPPGRAQQGEPQSQRGRQHRRGGEQRQPRQRCAMQDADLTRKYRRVSYDLGPQPSQAHPGRRPSWPPSVAASSRRPRASRWPSAPSSMPPSRRRRSSGTGRQRLGRCRRRPASTKPS